MNHLEKCFLAVLGSLTIAGCGAPSAGGEVLDELDVGKTSAALESEQTTNTPVVFVCSASTAFYLIFEVVHPTTVAPSDVFPVTIDITNLIPPTVAPFSGTFSSSQELLAMSATPASQSLSMGSFHFETGQILGNIGSATATLTATDEVGAPVVLDAGAFDYVITADSGSPQINGHCVPPLDQPSTLATIPIVRTPATKNDCKAGGWKARTDEAGNAFENEGRCIAYALH
jgi:hypothetical protein